MSLSGELYLSAGSQALQPILADRLQHGEARHLAFLACCVEQALVYERGDPFEEVSCSVSVAKSMTHRFYRFEATFSHKDRKSPKEPLLLGIEQLIAPGDGSAQRLLSLRKVTRSTC